MIVGFTRTSGVGVVFVSGAQALRMKIPTMKNNKRKNRFIVISLGLGRLLRREKRPARNDINLRVDRFL